MESLPRRHRYCGILYSPSGRSRREECDPQAPQIEEAACADPFGSKNGKNETLPCPSLLIVRMDFVQTLRPGLEQLEDRFPLSPSLWSSYGGNSRHLHRDDPPRS